eukprot:3848309-Lingulodinium_polyedra.AAC.1
MWWHEYNARERIGQQYRMVCQTSDQRVCGVGRIIADLVGTAGREAATQVRVVALYQDKASRTDQLGG